MPSADDARAESHVLSWVEQTKLPTDSRMLLVTGRAGNRVHWRSTLRSSYAAGRWQAANAAIGSSDAPLPKLRDRSGSV